nr:hypothetical protein [Gammaproteobacteria bacterium]
LHTFVATYTYTKDGKEESITVYFGAYLKNGGLSAEAMSLSDVKYATGSNLNKVDKEQFIGRLGAMGFVSEAEEVEAEVVAIADLTADATKLVKLVDVVVADNAAAKSETVNVVFYSDEACTTVAELSGVYESIEGYAIKATDSQINFYVTESSTPVAVVTLTEPYVLDATLEANKGKGTGYADLNQVTVGGVIWNVGGNTGMNPYRIGGKAIENVDRRVFSGSMISNNISLIAFVLGNANNVTVNSVRVDVYSTLSLAKAGAAGDVYSAAQTFTAGTTIIVERPAGADWSNCYFSITFNLTITASSNKYIELQGIVLNID